MATTHRIDPRIRAFGKARIDVTRRAQDENEWQSKWREPRFPFPFKFGKGWKHCIQYLVDDFAAEIGFFIDVLGFPVSAFSPNYAQFTGPGGEFTFAVAAVDGMPGTPPESICLQFMLDDLPATVQELERRGILFDHKPEAIEAGSAVAVLRTPHGVRLELWTNPEARPIQQAIEIQEQPQVGADFWADFTDESPEQNEQKAEEELPESTDDDADPGEAEDNLIAEPVYVDEAEDIQVEPLAAAPQVIPPGPRPSFPTTIIRRTEDILKTVGPLSARKTKGNGARGFPTMEDASED